MALHTYDKNTEEPIEYDLDESGNRIIRGSNNNDGALDAVEVAADTDDILTVRKILTESNALIKKVESEAKMSFYRQESFFVKFVDAV